jgi:hypothetical protein
MENILSPLITKRDPQYQIIRYFISENDYTLFDKKVKECNENNVNINSRFGDEENTVLHWAIYNSSVKMAIKIIENKDKFIPRLELTIQDVNGNTPLMAAIDKGYLRCNDNLCNSTNYHMGMFIDKYLAICSENDLKICSTDLFKNKIFHETISGYNAFEMALMYYDFHTISIMQLYHPLYILNSMDNDHILQVINDYYNISGINQTFISSLYISSYITTDNGYYNFLKSINYHIGLQNSMVEPENIELLLANKYIIFTYLQIGYFGKYNKYKTKYQNLVDEIAKKNNTS